MIRTVFIALVFLMAGRHTLAVQSIVINEFQTTSPQTVELYNNGTETVNLSGWHIDDSGGSTFYRIDDNTALAPGKCISFEGSFGLNTATADAVRLFTAVASPAASNAELVDAFHYDKITDAAKTFQRIPDGSSIWTTGAPSIDRFNLTGAPCTAPPSPTPTPSPTRTPTPTKTPTPQPTQTPSTTHSSPPTHEHIYITELLANPETGKQEWVELYNGNDTAVTLESWYIDDTGDAGATPYRFSLSIPTGSYAVIGLSGAMFNNDGDSVRLLDRNEVQKDAISYAGVDPDNTINRNVLTSPAVCFAQATKGAPNNPCSSLSITPTIEPYTALKTANTSSVNASADSITHQPLAAPAVSQSAPASSPISADESGAQEGTERQNERSFVLSHTQLNPYIRILLVTSITCALLTMALILFRMKSWYTDSTTGSPL